MEPPAETHLSYFPHQPPTTTSAAATPTTAAAAPTNGLLAGPDGTHMGFSQPAPVASAASQAEKKKRGRPRKYETPEQAIAARKAMASLSSRERREMSRAAAVVAAVSGSSYSPFSGYARRPQMDGIGIAGHSFTPHLITVAQGEDVAQKIMMFMQQSKREICVISASGSVSDASIRQPATSGGNMTYEGMYEIVTLTGSYVRSDMGGRSGGLSVCLCSTNGQIIGGSVGGPLRAACPVQVIVGSFLIDNKKDVNAGVKGDASASATVGGPSVSNISFRSPVESSAQRVDEQQNVGGSHFMSGMHVPPSRPTVWGSPDTGSAAGYDLTGRADHEEHHSPENGDYDQLAD